MLTPDLRFSSTLRLKRSKDLQALFQGEGHLFAYPLRLQFRLIKDLPGPPIQVAFSVSKRKCRHAVDRNRIRRRMREAWRLHWQPFGQSLSEKGVRIHIMLIYSGDVKDADYPIIAKGVRKALRRLAEHC